MKASTRIVRTSLSTQAHRILKTRILAGRIAPGTQLIVDDLAGDLRISRTPVREALINLVSMGLVTYDGNSYVAASYTARDVEELFGLRRTLETMAILEACRRLTDDQIAQFGVHCRRVQARIKSGADHKNVMITLDDSLHKLICEGSQNRRLREILIDLEEKLGLIYRWGRLTKNLDYEETATIEEYLGFLESFRSRDAAQAAELIQKHLLDGERFILEGMGFSERADAPSPAEPANIDQ